MNSLWSKCLIILLLSFSVPSLASFTVTEDKLSTEHVVFAPKTTINTTTDSESQISLITEFEAVTTFKTSKKPRVLNPNSHPQNSDYRSPALMRDSLLFRESVQCNPIYCLVVEFNPPDPAIRNTPDYKINDTELPWYLTAVQKSNGRLSSWKDGNTLYSSRTTYHSFLIFS